MSENTEATQKKETEKKRNLPQKGLLLFGAKDSQLFFVSVHRTKMTTDGFSFKTPTDYGIHLTKDEIIEGSNSGGCTKWITPALAKDFEMGYQELVELIENHNGYGRRFAFLSDKAASRPIIEQMRRQAAKEAAVNNEAMTEGIARSDMAVW